MPRQHRPLLGRLAVWFNEVIVTDALRLLLDDEPSAVAFLNYVGQAAGTDLSMVRSFERERGIDAGRIDLEGLDAEGRPRLLVEVKIGHLITGEQMSRYLAHQHDALAGGTGVLMLLVPASRVPEARLVMDSLAHASGPEQSIRPVVLSWEECLQAIADELQEGESGPISPAADVAQLESVFQAFSQWVPPPSTGADPDRHAHLRVLLDKLHERLRERLPSGPLVAADPAHVRRYFTVDEAGNYVSIGLVPGLETEGGSPFWLWVPQGTHDYAPWRATLRISVFREQLQEMAGGLWIPLLMGEDLGGPELVEHLAGQALAVVTLLQQSLPGPD